MNQGSNITRLLSGRCSPLCRNMPQRTVHLARSNGHASLLASCTSHARALTMATRLQGLGFLNHSKELSITTSRMASLRDYSSQPLRTRLVSEQAITASESMPPIPHFVLVRAPTPFQAYVKPVLFTAATSFAAFATAAYVWERHQVTLIKRIQAWRSSSKNDRPSAREFVEAQAEILQERWRVGLERFRWIQQIGIPVEIQKMLFVVRSRWMELTPGERTVWAIIGLNSIVFGAWQVPRLAPFMHKWFMHHPARSQSITLLTSMFSHQHFWHFGLNMFALYSFAVPLHDQMGREQFLAFYLTTGVTASLVSHLFTVARVPWAKIIPSLGASGALFGCLSSTAYMYPEATVYIIFLPFLPIKIPMALGAMMGLDLVGIIRNWRMFDHYAHLAGASFGLAYMYAGKDLIWTPLQQKAIELNKDSNLFGKMLPKASSQGEINQRRSMGSVKDATGTDRVSGEGERTAKDYAQARYNKLKSWWDTKRSGGNKDP